MALTDPKLPKVCVVGSGSREHALQSALSKFARVVVCPGNPGIPGSVGGKPEDIEADLFVIGPEAPLVDGLTDRLRAQGKLVFGPSADGAQLEGSKAWMKDLLKDAGVPTADYRSVTSLQDAQRALDELTEAGYVGWAIKTDGLAAGKGVTVTTDREVAIRDVSNKFDGAFGDAGRRLVIEGLLGSKTSTPSYEVSLFAICNGKDYVLLDGAQDYKLLRVDSHLNTGGMGAYSPTRDQSKLAQWAEVAIKPTLAELNKRDIDYRGVLYAGLMIVDGQPQVIEFNIRFGQPETEVLLPRITSNLVQTLTQAAKGEKMDDIIFSNKVMVGKVLASEGYPLSPRIGDEIQGLADAEKLPGVQIFCVGVAKDDTGKLVTAGGRVLVVTAQSTSPQVAVDTMNRAASAITWIGQQSRGDIGQELLSS